MADTFIPPPVSALQPQAAFTPPPISSLQPEDSHPVLDAVKDFASGAWSKLSPVQILKGMADTVQAAAADPVGTAKNFGKEVLAHPYMAIGRGIEAAKQGKIEEAAAHFDSALSPAGFQTEASQVKAATPGQRAEGLGEIAGTGANAYLTAKLPELPKAAAKVGAKALDLVPEAVGDSALQAGVGVLSPRAKNIMIALDKMKNARAAYQDAAAPAASPPPVPAQPPPLPQASPSPAAPPSAGPGGYFSPEEIAARQAAKPATVNPAQAAFEAAAVKYGAAPETIAKVADHLGENKITATAAAKLSPAEWQNVAKAAGVDPLSPKGTMQVLAELRARANPPVKIVEPSPEYAAILAKNPKAAAAARAMAEATQ